MIGEKKKKSYVKRAKWGTAKRKSQIFARRSKGRFGSFLHQFVGLCLLLVGGFVFGALFLESAYYGVGLGWKAYIMLIFFAAGCFLFYRGRSYKKFLDRFRFYSRLLENRDVITFTELSHLTRRDVNFLKKDIKKMLERKMFLQGKIDQQETAFFLTHQAYEEYLSQQPYEEPGKAAEQIPPEKEEITNEEVNLEEPPKTFTETAEEYLRFYEEMQKKIRFKDVQKTVTDLGVYTVRILAYDIENEARERFLSYYLPVTKKLLITYSAMEREGIGDKANDLKDMLNTIRYSFETFAHKLAEGENMDVETDIMALELIMSR